MDEAEAAKFAGLLTFKIIHLAIITIPFVETITSVMCLFCSDHQGLFMMAIETLIDINILCLCLLVNL